MRKVQSSLKPRVPIAIRRFTHFSGPPRRVFFPHCCRNAAFKSLNESASKTLSKGRVLYFSTSWDLKKGFRDFRNILMGRYHDNFSRENTCSDYAKINYEKNNDHFTAVFPCPCLRQPCDHVRERDPQFRSCGTWGVAGVLIRLHQYGN